MKKTLITIMVLIGMHLKAQAHYCCDLLMPKSQAPYCPVKYTQYPQPRPKIQHNIQIVIKPVVVEKPVPFVVEKEVVKVIEKPVHITRTVVKKVQKKNRISAIAGLHPIRLNINSSGTYLESDFVYGMQYQRMLNETTSIGIQLQSNGVVSGTIGFDF
jgi:hypothetical protein